MAERGRRPLTAGAGVARDERIVPRLRDREDTRTCLLAEVVGLDQHVLGDQPPDQVAPEGGEPLGVALTVRLVGSCAGLGSERLPGLLHLHSADELPSGARLEGRAGEGVVDPVRDEDAPQSKPVEVVEAAVDVRAGALREPLELAAPERVRGLHADEYRELAALDRTASLPGAVD